ncbi:MAG: hypothetical protein PVJ49_20040 [Acidobacteriota bacterium]|jgi:hypothetical protein
MVHRVIESRRVGSRRVAGFWLLATLAALAAVTACAHGAGQDPSVAPPEHPSPSPLPASFAERPPIEVDPDGTNGPARLIRYPAVSLAEREGHIIELVEELGIVAGDGGSFTFERAANVVIDEHDEIYVHDSERYRIVVFEPDGGFARAYGGAGEMAPFHLGWIALAGNRLAISTGTKIAVWSLDRRHLYDRSLLSRAFSRDVQGTEDGNLVGSFEMLSRTGEPWYSVEKVSLDEDRSFTYGAVRMPPRDAVRPRARPGFAATRDGGVYLTRGDEYAVMAYAADGRELWALQVDPLAVSAPGPELSVPAGGQGYGHPLRTDGSGNLYVFPYPGPGWDRDVVPVDVYTPQGERIFAGFMAPRSWVRAKDDAVYGIEADGDAGRERVVRYRLRTPFPLVATR